jgi:hypothetical protein
MVLKNTYLVAYVKYIEVGRCRLLKSVSVIGYFFGYFNNRVGFSVSVNEKTDIFGYFSVIVKL